MKKVGKKQLQLAIRKDLPTAQLPTCMAPFLKDRSGNFPDIIRAAKGIEMETGHTGI